MILNVIYYPYMRHGGLHWKMISTPKSRILFAKMLFIFKTI